MTLGSMILNIVSLSSALGALLVLAAMWLLLRSRGVLYLFLFILALGLDYLTGILLFSLAPQPAAAGGLAAAAALPGPGRLLLAFKYLCQAGLLVTGPLTVHALLGRPVGSGLRAALAAAAAGIVLAGAAALISGTAAPAWVSAVLVTPLFLSYAMYLYCLAFLFANRGRARPGFARGTAVAAAVALACVVPALIGEDLYLLLAQTPPRVLTDPIAFLLLTGGTLLLCVIWLARSLRPGLQQGQLDAFCRRHALSPREREVLLHLVEGRSYKEIASALAVSPDTVKTHISHIYRKTGASGRVDLRYRLRADEG